MLIPSSIFCAYSILIFYAYFILNPCSSFHPQFMLIVPSFIPAYLFHPRFLFTVPPSIPAHCSTVNSCSLFHPQVLLIVPSSSPAHCSILHGCLSSDAAIIGKEKWCLFHCQCVVQILLPVSEMSVIKQQGCICVQLVRAYLSGFTWALVYDLVGQYRDACMD